MNLGKEALLVILQAAAEEPYGLVLRTSDTGRARAALYKVRSDAKDDRLTSLQLRVSPFPDGDLIICHPPQTTPPAPRHGTPLDLGDLLE